MLTCAPPPARAAGAAPRPPARRPGPSFIARRRGPRESVRGALPRPGPSRLGPSRLGPSLGLQARNRRAAAPSQPRCNRDGGPWPNVRKHADPRAVPAPQRPWKHFHISPIRLLARNKSWSNCPTVGQLHVHVHLHVHVDHEGTETSDLRISGQSDLLPRASSLEPRTLEPRTLEPWPKAWALEPRLGGGRRAPAAAPGRRSAGGGAPKRRGPHEKPRRRRQRTAASVPRSVPFGPVRTRSDPFGPEGEVA